MNFCVKLLSMLLILVMLATTVVSCMPQSNTKPSVQGGIITDNGITVYPPNSNNGSNNNNNNGNNVGSVVVGNATAPYVGDVHVSAGVTPDENNQVPSEGVTLDSSLASATIPGGVQMEEGATELSLTINGLDESAADVTLSDTEISSSLDVHVSGVAQSNLVPMEVKLLAAALKGLNSTSIKLYHVENGETIAMTYVPTNEPFTAHNQFKYDPATGDVILYIASFSEIMMVADTVNAWKGNFDYTWYDADATQLYIANADQLAAFGAIVGGMKKVTGRVDNKYTYSEEIIQDSFVGKTVTLIADIDLGDKESENNENIIFYPIGYWNDEGTYDKNQDKAISSGFYSFMGTFDGNGHTISNFYQNTWEMKGDHNWYAPEDQHYRDGMGLFGKIYGGTVKNLTIDNFSSDGEIATTGVIAAYADGATFSNISIFNCNPRVYNIGNGGIVGCVGWYAKDAGLKTTFTNITVDNTNKISALWGSYDVACGGILGQYYPTSGQSSAEYPVNGGIEFTNCHVSAQMDVYNDVCANYQYYAYRYTGMLIGSVRENETINGRVYPKMDGITASGCTVHFGTWNDYYYCELVANTTASYTHDHQMSRLTQVESVDVENKTITTLDGETVAIPTSGRANYVVVNGDHASENATCYHFVDGAVWNHEDSGYHDGSDGGKIIDEDGDGNPDLKEDKQHLYLEFNNLFTGYGWGVTSKGLEDFVGVTNMDIKQGDREFSIEKFENIKTDLTDNRVYKLGDIFSYVNNGVPLKTEGLLVSITNLDKVNNPVSATINYDRENWANSTIEFVGTGTITITIQDYYFCTPTEITVTITERQPEVKFDVVLNNGDFLHRVGNTNDVTLKYLFDALGGVTIGSTVEVSLANISGNVTAEITSATIWNDATLDFDGTGVVKVIITDNDWCTPTELYLEVVNANNITSATGSNGTDVVLLKDVKIAANNAINYTNCTVYGNGFTFDVCGGMNQYNSKQGHGIININGTTIDNLRIIGDVYDEYGLYTKADMAGTTLQNDYTTAVDATDSIIQNCYIANCSAPVRAKGVTIVNTTLYGGTVANLLINSGNNVLRDVTTINYNDGRGVIGMGIVFTDTINDSTSLTINGYLKQHNYVYETDVNDVSVEAAKEIISSMFEDAFSIYHISTDNGIAVNTGIVSINQNYSITNSLLIDNANTGYQIMNNVTLKIAIQGMGSQNVTAHIATIPAANASVDNNYIAKAPQQGDYLPTPNFNLGNQAVSGDDRYVKGDINGVEIRYMQGETPLTLDITNLMTVYKYEGVNYSVAATCKDSNGNVVNISTALATQATYTLEFTIEDDEFYGSDGAKLDKSVTRTYQVPLSVIIAQPEIQDAVITVNNTAQSGSYSGITDKTITFNPLNAITITDAEGAVNLTTNIASTTITYDSSSSAFAGATHITVTYNDGRVLTITLGKPSLNSPGSSKAITYANDGTIKSAGAVASKSATGGTWTVTSYSFKGTNGKTVTNNTVVTFTFPDKSCVTGDTLVMLADGSQKRIDEVTYEDQLLVWNFFTGTYDVVPSAIIFYHGDAEYDVLNLNFNDGTTVKVINNHGFYDVELNKFVFIDTGNVSHFLGHKFVKVNGSDYTSVELVSYEITQEYTGCYSIQSAMHNNFMVEGMFSLTIPHYEGWFDYFEIGEGMKYDEENMQADIEKYGLYTYEDFAEYVTYEQFIAFNGPYLKVLVGRGVVTYDQIIELISMYVPQN